MLQKSVNNKRDNKCVLFLFHIFDLFFRKREPEKKGKFHQPFGFCIKLSFFARNAFFGCREISKRDVAAKKWWESLKQTLGLCLWCLLWLTVAPSSVHVNFWSLRLPGEVSFSKLIPENWRAKFVSESAAFEFLPKLPTVKEVFSFLFVGLLLLIT